jgi:hypothetical protein
MLNRLKEKEDLMTEPPYRETANEHAVGKSSPRASNSVGRTGFSISFILLLISMAFNLYLVILQDWSFVVVAPETSVVHVRSGGDTVSNVHQDVAVVYGLVHMAKTAGSEINGELASHFERVCGNKGFSYDAYQFNERARANAKSGVISARNASADLISQQYPLNNRGKVPSNVMREIGFEDCDYISMEGKSSLWQALKKSPSLELHVPCRDPLTHLMSQCNHRMRRFNCATDDLRLEIKRCSVGLYRFSRALGEQENTNLKCFNPIPIEPYLEYMSERLQRKRIESNYVHRITNKAHNKISECIWNKPDVATQVRDILVQEYDFYGWCRECLGSKDDLLANAQ